MSSINFRIITKIVYFFSLLFLFLGHKYVSDNLIWPHRSYAPPFIFFLFESEFLLLTCFLFIVSSFLLNIQNKCFISGIYFFSFVRFLFVFFFIVSSLLLIFSTYSWRCCLLSPLDPLTYFFLLVLKSLSDNYNIWNISGSASTDLS